MIITSIESRGNENNVGNETGDCDPMDQTLIKDGTPVEAAAAFVSVTDHHCHHL